MALFHEHRAIKRYEKYALTFSLRQNGFKPEIYTTIYCFDIGLKTAKSFQIANDKITLKL